MANWWHNSCVSKQASKQASKAYIQILSFALRFFISTKLSVTKGVKFNPGVFKNAWVFLFYPRLKCRIDKAGRIWLRPNTRKKIQGRLQRWIN